MSCSVTLCEFKVSLDSNVRGVAYQTCERSLLLSHFHVALPQQTADFPLSNSIMNLLACYEDRVSAATLLDYSLVERGESIAQLFFHYSLHGSYEVQLDNSGSMIKITNWESRIKI